MIKTCKECGKEFETKSSRAQYCNNTHYRKCECCGALFLVDRSKLPFETKTCSEKCRRELISRSSKAQLFDCICEICNQSFQSSSPNARVCNRDHYTRCKVCGKEFKLTHEQAIANTQTCSKECRYKLAEQTNLKKYGVSNAMQSQTIKEKFQKTLQSTYGAINPSQISDYNEKRQATCKMKYGVSHQLQNAEIKANRTKTNLAKYGTAEVLSASSVRSKIQETCIEKYGVDNPSKSDDVVVKLVTNPKQYSNWISFKENPKLFISNHFINEPSLLELSELCGVHESTIGQLILHHNLQDTIKYVYSSMEDEVIRFIRSISDTAIQTNIRSIITPYEIDIYLPEFKLGIECDPTITHNSSVSGFNNDQPKATTYHKMKTDLAEAQGVFLFHIFGYDWTHKKDVIKSMLSNLLRVSETKIYARQTIVKEIDDTTAFQFINTNHRQPGVHSSIRLGLYKDEELVSMMTFSKMRNTIGTDKTDLTDCYELVRFCNKLNTNVVGGASKLFNYFVTHYSPTKIRSFSDRSHTKGNLYPKLGFTKIRTSDPGYVWVNLKDDKPYNRVNAQKRNIQNFLKDDSIDLTQSENTIMTQHGFVKVCDSGTITWEWTSSESL